MATLELLGAIGTTLVAILIPVAALVIVLIMLFWSALRWSKSHHS